MLLKKKDNSRNRSIAFSLFFHSCIFIILCLMLLEKRLDQKTFFNNLQRMHQENSTNNILQQQSLPDIQEEKKTLPSFLDPKEDTFVVPAPVVYYGNQAMMNLPVPVAGSSSGTSGFDEKPTALPTPPVLKTVEKQKISSDALFPQEQTTAFDDSSVIEESPTKSLSSSAFVAFKESIKESAGPAQKKITLADLFKNAQSEISQMAQEGQTSATKAGTEGGDIHGSGSQVTIKEGDMKYYTLWAKFLNHLNQAARFSRRGKEQLIRQWIENGDIQYVLQCAITIDIQGNLIAIDLTHSSGCKKFDEMCKNDIRSAVPFPPLASLKDKKTARFEVSVYP